MSLQHVLATAKKLGIPVVITNEAGEGSQVVMPFDDFAAMVGNQTPAVHSKSKVNTPRVVATGPTSRIDERDEIAEALSEIQFEGLREEPFTRDDLSAPSPAPSSGLSDDKFYLEPIEEKEDLNF